MNNGKNRNIVVVNGVRKNNQTRRPSVHHQQYYNVAKFEENGEGSEGIIEIEEESENNDNTESQLYS